MGEEANVEMETSTFRKVFEVMRSIGHLFVAIFLFYCGVCVFMPYLMDILLGAICPGQLECPILIYMTGTFSVLIGIGTVVLAPLLGSLSDEYGRRPILHLVICTAVVPAVLLAYSRSTVVVYVWYFTFSVTAILREGGLTPALLAYVADVVDEKRRGLAVSLSLSALYVGFLTSMIIALAVKYDYQAYWVAAVLQIIAAIYAVVFLKESNKTGRLLGGNSQSESTMRLLAKPGLKRQKSNLRDTARTIANCSQLRIIALVDFMNSFGSAGLNSFALYFLKSQFDFGKNEFAYLVIIAAICGTVGQVFIYPLLSHYLGERGALSFGLFFTSLHYFAYGLAWAWWVPFAGASMAAFYACLSPALGTLVSRSVDRDVQGKVQGFMAGVRSAGVISAPLLLTPLTAASLGENPPLNMPGLPFVLCGCAMVVAWLISLGLSSPPVEVLSKAVDIVQSPIPPESFVQVSASQADVLHIPATSETSS